MTMLNFNSRHVRKTDTRYVISRAEWDFPHCASVDLFPADPSEFQSDLVWEEDVAHLMRRQVAVQGPDGTFPVVNYRMKGTRQWDIPLRVLKVLNPNIEDATTDPAQNPRMRRLRAAWFKIRMEREISAWQVLRDPAVVTQNITLAAGSRFDDILSVNSDPIAVLRLACRRIKERTGRKATDIYIPEAGYLQMCRHEKIQREAVNKLSLTEDRSTINANIIERLLDDALIEKGAVKPFNVIFNNTNDGPSATEQLKYVYPSGPMVIVATRAIPGGTNGSDYGFGLGKYLDHVKSAFKDDPSIQIATGNEGLGVYEAPEYEMAGHGTQSQVLSAWAPFVQQEQAAFAIYGAFNAADTATYQNLFTF